MRWIACVALVVSCGDNLRPSEPDGRVDRFRRKFGDQAKQSVKASGVTPAQQQKKAKSEKAEKAEKADKGEKTEKAAAAEPTADAAS